ncbi:MULTISPECIES: hypothetical protein [unclassified Variovorax]|uniref:hypothetical protein n=1 Tax=unclassified Variovorax TaxID=663243 RepID=UPI0013188BC5|nr:MULTISPECIES: hypothetical protein [unclassified Variovorax]VTU42189.1 hypothetical protein H6P1_00126 [Variovorax sp. PBL-H6]VTU44183.1 hypothetical protein SRS16P1_00776 [Variovorax sp. SRS16]VTU44264.1 hypothetical protein E5P1_00769 [Variovorax sp. PBL-E5]
MSRNMQQSVPLSKRLITFGCALAFGSLIVDAPWPIYAIFGYNISLNLILCFAFSFVAFLGFVLGLVETTAAHAGRRRVASAAAVEPEAEAVTSSPVGEAVMPKA